MKRLLLIYTYILLLALVSGSTLKDIGNLREKRTGSENGRGQDRR